MSNDIDGPTDITEDDVQTAHDFAQLCLSLYEYAQERPDHKNTFDKVMLQSLTQSSTDLYHQLSVVYAQTQESMIDPSDVIDDLQKRE